MSPSQARPPPGVDPTKFAQRAIGRSPEEHAALERVLAERRRLRGDSGSGSGSNNNRARSRSPVPDPGQERRADLARQRRDLERREKELERRREELRFQQMVQEHEHNLEQRRLRQEQQLAAQQQRRIAAQAQAQEVVAGGPSEDAEAQALLSLSVAQRRAALLAPFGVTGPRRRAKGKSKGTGWHKRGYRDANGDMWINVKIGEECTQGQDVWEGDTLVGFVKQVQSKCRHFWVVSGADSPRIANSTAQSRSSRRLRLRVPGATGYYELGPAFPEEVPSAASHEPGRGWAER